MIYVMSDIHGCYDKYVKMLDLIQFKQEDTLYILGDVLDRGPNGMETLLDIEKRSNVVLLRGNHDHQAGILLSNLHLLDTELCSKELIELYGIWLSDGGDKTLAEYLALSDANQEKVIQMINNSKGSLEICVGDKRFLLAHTVPGIEKLENYREWTLEDYILGEPDYEKIYFKDKYIVTGHTPTGFIEQEYVGKIWKKNNHIAIDCGAVYGKCLGCLCLDSLEEFYVN